MGLRPSHHWRRISGPQEIRCRACAARSRCVDASGPAGARGGADYLEIEGPRRESQGPHLQPRGIRVAAGKQLILARSFFAPTAFSKPESREVWLQRVRGNFGHYRSLYGILLLVVAIYYVLSSPLLLFGLTVLAAAWSY